jgi:hypothetical protein
MQQNPCAAPAAKSLSERCEAGISFPAALPGCYNGFIMTKLMEQAIERLRALPPEKQVSIAGTVLHELDSSERWDELFSQS